MAYRQAAEPPKTEPRPIERLSVSRYGTWPAIALVFGSIVLGFFIGWTVHGSAHIVCTRASAGDTPRCTATQKAGFGTADLEPFDLNESSLSVGEREWDDSMHVIVKTPEGELRGGVDKTFAEATVAGAKRFVATPNELRWEASTRNTWTMVLSGAGALAFVICILLIVKRTWVTIDHDAGVVRVGKHREHRLIEISSAKVEEIDDSAFHKVLLSKKDGTTISIADGRKGECDALASALRRAVADLSPKRREEDENPPPHEPAPSDEAKWDRAETLLRTLPLDGCALTRNTEDRRLEARGTRRELPVLVEIDPIHPNGVEIEVQSNSKLDLLDVSYRKDEKPDAKHPERVFFGEGVFTDDEEEAAVLRAMPAAFRERILTAMTAYDIQNVAVWGERTTLASREPRTLEDPYSRLPAMLDLVIDIAEYAAKHDTKASPESSAVEESSDDSA